MSFSYSLVFIRDSNFFSGILLRWLGLEPEMCLMSECLFNVRSPCQYISFTAPVSWLPLCAASFVFSFFAAPHPIHPAWRTAEKHRKAFPHSSAGSPIWLVLLLAPACTPYSPPIRSI